MCECTNAGDYGMSLIRPGEGQQQTDNQTGVCHTAEGQL